MTLAKDVAAKVRLTSAGKEIRMRRKKPGLEALMEMLSMEKEAVPGIAEAEALKAAVIPEGE